MRTLHPRCVPLRGSVARFTVTSYLIYHYSAHFLYFSRPKTLKVAKLYPPHKWGVLHCVYFRKSMGIIWDLEE
jgi:hypothetical protein